MKRLFWLAIIAGVAVARFFIDWLDEHAKAQMKAPAVPPEAPPT